MFHVNKIKTTREQTSRRSKYNTLIIIVTVCVLWWEKLTEHRIAKFTVGLFLRYLVSSVFYGVVDGGWSSWQVWSSCSAECGLGAQARSRTCSAPPPQGSGNPCSGLVTEVRHCFERPCAGNLRTRWVEVTFVAKAIQTQDNTCLSGNSVSQDEVCFLSLKQNVLSVSR